MGRDKKNMIDTSYLSADKTDERGIIHRDLIAHAFRWSYALRILPKAEGVRILDVGCGVEAPLAKTLYVNRFTKHKYLGVDYGPIRPNIKFSDTFTPIFREKTDFSTMDSDDVSNLLGGLADFVFSFEVFEHMMPDRLAALLLKIHEVSDKNATFVFSTPVYDHRVGSAANHINEMTIWSLGAMLEAAGFAIEDRFGTFASIRDYKDELESQYGDSGMAIFNRLREYYDTNVIANIFGPLFPDQARNNVWVCRKKTISDSPTFSTSVLFSSDPQVRGQCESESSWYAARQILGIPEPVRIKVDGEAVEPDSQSASATILDTGEDAV